MELRIFLVAYPDKNGNDPVLESLQSKLQNLSLEWVDICLPQENMETLKVVGFEIDQPILSKRSHNRLNCEKNGLNLICPCKFLDYLASMDLEDPLLKQSKIKKFGLF